MRFPLTLAVCLSASPALAIDNCLIGTWQADAADIARSMAAQMNGGARHVGGQVTMKITNTGSVEMRAENLVMSVSPDGIPAMDVTVNGYSRGTMQADDGNSFTATVPEYALVGSADVLGQRMEIPFTSASGMLGNASGTYQCNETNAQFAADNPGSMPGTWQRLR